MTFHQKYKKNYFHCTCIVLDLNIILKEIDQKFRFGGLIVYGNSCMGYFFANSKIFNIHAIVLDVVESVKSPTNKGLVMFVFYLDFQVVVFLVT